jgi:uncharacterized membrane protein YfcA
LIFAFVALIYSSVGLGGGSAYVAILILLMIEPISTVRFTALLCNIVVVAGSCINFYRAGLLNWRKVIPLVVLSVPLAFLGGRMTPDTDLYLKLTAFILVIIAFLMLVVRTKERDQGKEIPAAALAGLGGGIGFISGVIGIGGGVFISPVLHLMRWADAKRISAALSAFVLINSCAAIAGILSSGVQVDFEQTGLLALAVLIGGQIGNRLNIFILSPGHIRVLTALLVGFVGVKVLLQVYQ